MSSWKVSKERITLFPHPKAEKLELGKVGAYQVVVQKGLYNDGDEVVFVPQKSILNGALQERFASYLVGPEKNRVQAIALRGEMSCGIILSPDVVAQQTGQPLNVLPEGEDLSERMDITKYEPPIPINLAGEVEASPSDVRFGQHECEQFGVYADQLQVGEDVVITVTINVRPATPGPITGLACVTAGAAGSYSVNITTLAGCTERPPCVPTNFSGMILDGGDNAKAPADAKALLNDGSGVVISPNPSTGRFVVNILPAVEDAHITLFNANGQQVGKPERLRTGQNKLGNEDLASGIYTVRIYLNGEWITRQVAVTKD